MALTQTPFPNPLQVGIAFDDDAKSASDLNIQGAEAVRLHVLEAVNTTGGATTNFIKLYDLNAVTAGTSLPDFILPIVNATTRTIFFFEDGESGVTFENGLSERAVSNAGTGGTTDPGAAMPIGFWTSEIPT